MRVAYVTMQFPTPPETFASNEVRELTSLDVGIEVHSLRPPHPHAEELRKQRSLVHVPVSHNGLMPSLRGVVAALGRPVTLWKALRWIWSRCRSQPRHLPATLALLPRAFDILAQLEQATPDIVHLYWGHYPSLVGFLVQERLRSVAVSMALNAYDLTLEYPCSIDVARRADFLRTHTRANVAHVSRFVGVPHDSVTVIYNGVDLRGLQGLAELETTKVPQRLAVASRLIESKGVDKVIRILANLKPRWPRSSLVVMGDGPARASLERLAGELNITDAVTFLGHVDHEIVLREVAASQALVFMSSKEGERLPNVVKEAMAVGTVAIVSPTPGIEELIEPGRTGFIVDAVDLEATTDLLERLFAADLDTGDLVENARAHIEKHFSLRESAKTYLECWREALELKRASLVTAPAAKGELRA